MGDLTGISTVLSSLVAAKDITQAMVGLRDAAALNGKIAELNSKIIDAQSGVFLVNEERATLIKRVSDLEKEIADRETWEREKQRYELRTVSPHGSLAYVLKEDLANGEPPHLICANCYQKHKKALLQGITETNQRYRQLQCFDCKNKITIGPQYVIRETQTRRHAR